jgi:serine/threonine protein phosphatase PrpC
MPLTHHWLTHAGLRTADNRDAYTQAQHTEATLYFVADGSSSRPGSGELAHALADYLHTAFLQLPTAVLSRDALAPALCAALRDARHELGRRYPQAACSYLLLALLPEAAFSLHEGDCCLGQIDSLGNIQWLNAPHCQANWRGTSSHADLARDSARHRLTRCFSARRQPEPQLSHWPLTAAPQWLLATDGFWADLTPQQQSQFLHNGQVTQADTDDDISCLLVSAPRAAT